MPAAASPSLRALAAAAALLLAAPGAAAAQTAADSAAIRATALDYIQGWYEGDAERMQRALHPKLAKRIVRDDAGDTAGLDDMSAAQLVEATRRGGGRGTPAGRRRDDVRILDVFGDAASVRVDAADWVDYIQMGRVDGRWVIVNVLWETRPRR